MAARLESVAEPERRMVVRAPGWYEYRRTIGRDRMRLLFEGVIRNNGNYSNPLILGGCPRIAIVARARLIESDFSII